MSELTEMELAVLKKLLDGPHVLLDQWRAQLPYCRVANREHTGVGFFAHLEVPPAFAINTVNTCFGDVVADITGMRHGAGFVLYIQSGRLHMLEGYGYDEAWPTTITSYHLEYDTGKSRDWTTLNKLLIS